MRPKQWIKNSFVFAGLIFSKSFLHLEPILRTLCCFVLFSLVSGSVYIINDLIDRRKDALHPVKRSRPIASGRLKYTTALAFALIISIFSLSISYFFNFKFFLVLLVYFFLVLAYSLKLKNVVILDVIVLSMGFVLRTAGGAVAIDVWISPWLR